jgi:hypothetical protein
VRIAARADSDAVRWERDCFLAAGFGQTWSVGMIHSSAMEVWLGRVTMSATLPAM